MHPEHRIGDDFGNCHSADRVADISAVGNCRCACAKGRWNGIQILLGKLVL